MCNYGVQKSRLASVPSVIIIVYKTHFVVGPVSINHYFCVLHANHDKVL